MKYSDFYNIATYGNNAWNGSYSPEEVTENAANYYADFLWSKANRKLSFVIKELLRLLEEDGTEQCRKWAMKIRKEVF